MKKSDVGLLGDTKGNSSFNISTDVNDLWSLAERGRKVSVPRVPLIKQTTKIFTIGSCFALEIHSALSALGYEMYPEYSKLQVNVGREVAGLLPDKSTLAYYTPASIHQEIMRALNCEYYEKDDLYSAKNPKNYFARKLNQEEVFHDPYRRDIYASDMSSLLSLSRRISKRMQEGIEKADVLIITLGLIEAWRNRANGLWVCRCPVKSDDPEWTRLELNILSATDCYFYLNDLLTRLFQVYPQKKVILTVSPIPLGKTFSGDDIVVANTNSKSTLRVVTGQIVREWENQVFYWPSYEYAMGSDVFEEDGRHVQQGHIYTIVSDFLRAFAG